ncbi:MAG: metal ABC transporter ATP-binding protein [Acidimicrobiia bacterium]
MAAVVEGRQEARAGEATSVVLQADGLSFAYRRQLVLDGVSLAVGPGEFVALAGPNGSGKSTLLGLLLGLTRLQAGSVTLFGVSPQRLGQRWRIGYVPQRPALVGSLPATVEEVVAAGRLARCGWRGRLGKADWVEVAHAIESVGLADRRRARLGELSVGQQQRAFIAKAFAGRPELLVLDEPIAGVDLDSQARFRDSLVHLIADHGAAVLLVSHELGAVADDLDRLLVLRGGRIAFDGTPDELTARGVSLGIHHQDLPLWLERPDH